MSGQERRNTHPGPITTQRRPCPTQGEKQFNKSVITAARDRTPELYVDFLLGNLDANSAKPWTIVSLVTALHRFGTCCRNHKLAAEKICLLLERLAVRFEMCTEPLNAQEVGNAFYGLQGVGTAHLDAAGLTAFTKVLDVLASLASRCTEPLNAQEVGNAFYGLQGVGTADLSDSGKTTLAKVLSILADKVDACTAALDSRAIGNAFYGLKNIDASIFNDAGRKAVRKAMEAFTKHIKKSQNWFRSEDLGVAFEALGKLCGSSLDGDLRETALQLHASLTEKLATKADGLRPNDVAGALRTLRVFDTTNLDDDSRAALATTIGNLSGVVAQCLMPFTARHIASALFGVQGMETAYLDEPGRKAVVQLLKVLTDKTSQCTEPFNSQDIGMAFMGLQGIDTTVLDDYGRKVIKASLASLTLKAATSSEPLSAVSVKNACVGLRGFLPKSSGSPACSPVADAINEQAALAAEAVLARMAAGSVASVSEASYLAAVLRVCHQTDAPQLSGFVATLWQDVDGFWVGHSSSGGTNVDEDFLITLVQSEQAYALHGRPMPGPLVALLATYRPQIDQLYGPTALEKECGPALSESLGLPVAHNQLVDGFELDLSFGNDGRLFNVEVDGPTHRKLSKRLSDEQRDTFLRSKGYTVIRVSADTSSRQIVDQVFEAVAAES